MSLVKQVGLLAAGCQPWNADVCAASGDRFAYCATLAVYVYQLDRKYNEFKLVSIMSEHKKTIHAISWNPRNADEFATASADNVVIIWNVAEQRVVARLNNCRIAPTSVGWCLHEKDCISFAYGKGPLFMWSFHSGGNVTPHKDAQNFMSDICQFRWHPKKTGKLAFGHNDGSVSLFCRGQRIWKHVLRPEDLEGTDEEDPVTALEWDPLSTEYLLISNTHFGVRLLDTEGVSVIMKFQLPSKAAQVHTLAWIGSAPGMFVTGDSHSGIMRLWNVSKQTPIENLRLKKTGFHALHVFTTAPGNHGNSTSDTERLEHLAAAPTTSATGRYALPPAHAVCTFLDGGVGLYDLGKRRWSFLRDLGHIETIFDCKFKPDNPDHIATASFDGTIKIWDVNTLEAVNSSPGNEGIIYCLSWAPADLNCVAACTSKNGAFIWDIGKGKVIKRFHEHGKASVYSVAWNQKDSRRLATCGGDGYCIIRQVDGKLLMKYKHSGPVFGCDWSPHNKDMIATGCEDKSVRVFYMATTNDKPLKVFSGHQAKVFQVKWSPLREGLLCSGSDDCTVRVWDYTQDCCVNVLSGHKGPVRGLLWNTEIPYLLVTGSWDYTIRVWDIRDGAELDTVLDHGADVYGLTIHPARPFTLASSSRDSTVRIWSLTPLTQPLEINILAQKPWEEITTNPEHAVSQGAPPLLSGKISRDIKLLVEKASGGSARADSLKSFSKFFSSARGVSNLWELVSVVMGMTDDRLSPEYSLGIMHMKHLAKFKSSKAQELELVKMSKFGAGIGAPTREERLNDAANIHIRLGNIQKYCEILLELGQWDKALAVAPGVSVSYWKTLTERRAKSLVKEDSDEAVPYCVASGNSEVLVKFFISHGQLTDAMMTSVAAYEGAIAPPEGSRRRSKRRSSINGEEGDTEDNLRILHETSEDLADWYFRTGLPVLAACCHFAVEDCRLAMAKLIRGGELELAVSVGLCLDTLDNSNHGKKRDVKDLTCLVAQYLARRCERLGKWELAVDLLKAVLPNPAQALAKLCARCAASMAEINDLHRKAGFPSMDDCLSEAERLKTKAGGEIECVKYYLLSTEPEKGLELGLKFVRDKMSRSGWHADEVFDMLQLLSSIQTEKLQHQKLEKLRIELLLVTAYVGALVAVRRGYDSIVPALYAQVNALMKKDVAEISLSQSLISTELEAWQAHMTVQKCNDPSTPSRPDAAMTIEQKSMHDDMLRKAGGEWSPEGVGPDVMSGSQLPSHSDVHVSCITGQRIQGAGFFLEDGKSAISLNDAVMWAKVNPFSPLGSAVRINPF